MDTKKPADFDFLLQPSVQFRNQVSSPSIAPVEEPSDKRAVSGKEVLEVFWSEEFQANRPSLKR